MNVNLQHTKYYLMVLILGMIVVVLSLGSGLYPRLGGMWQYSLFGEVCHQNPDRSFFIGDYPMAVCSRCFGFYSSFAAAWVVVPVMGTFIQKSAAFYGKLLAIVLGIIAADIVLNSLSFWINTNLSRFFTGLLLGLSVAFAIGSQFLTSK